VNVQKALDFQPLPNTTVRQQILGLAQTMGLRPAEEPARAGG
jgi:hypothetical protein